MSFVAFLANYPGTPPAPFRPFPAGEPAFFLVGVATPDGHPAPAAQLSVSKVKAKGTGRDPVDTVTETAKAWQGRRRITVATRRYSFERYTRGALALAREAARWTAPGGTPLSLWSFVVAVVDAASMGYRVPSNRMSARPGSRGEGHENTARATVRGSRVVAAPVAVSTPAPVVAAPATPLRSRLAGLAGIAADTAATADAARATAAQPTASWVSSFAAAPDAIRERGAAQRAREAAAAAVRAENAAQAARAVQGPSLDGDVARFAALELGDAAAPTGEAVNAMPVDPGVARFAALDLD